MSDSDRIRWNERYSERGEMNREPDSYLVSLDPILPRCGRALDVAGGCGRHAIWLAARGLEVTVADVSEVGLERAEASARDAGVMIHTLATDLTSESLPEGPWDVIVDFFYLQRSLFAGFVRALAPGGYLVFAQPTMTNLQRHPQPGSRFLLQDGELPELIANLATPGLHVIDYREGWTAEGQHEARLLAQRPTE